MNTGAKILMGLVRAYQWTIGPLHGPTCRYYPTCSEYAIEALRRHGALHGGYLAVRRILRCNPWHRGGFDPVPPTHDEAAQTALEGRHRA